MKKSSVYTREMKLCGTGYCPVHYLVPIPFKNNPIKCVALGRAVEHDAGRQGQDLDLRAGAAAEEEAEAQLRSRRDVEHEVGIGGQRLHFGGRRATHLPGQRPVAVELGRGAARREQEELPHVHEGEGGFEETSYLAGNLLLSCTAL